MLNSTSPKQIKQIRRFLIGRVSGNNPFRVATLAGFGPLCVYQLEVNATLFPSFRTATAFQGVYQNQEEASLCSISTIICYWPSSRKVERRPKRL